MNGQHYVGIAIIACIVTAAWPLVKALWKLGKYRRAIRTMRAHLKRFNVDPVKVDAMKNTEVEVASEALKAALNQIEVRLRAKLMLKGARDFAESCRKLTVATYAATNSFHDLGAKFAPPTDKEGTDEWLN